jgi:hypothetical protein
MATRGPHIAFARLPEVAAGEILQHMSDPRISRHMPLLKGPWDHAAVAAFIAAKEEGWRRDGLGHWAILCDRRYAGWGGFQREGDEWDYGLVLKPEYFGLGMRISKKAIEFARADDRIPFVTLLLPPSRHHLGALARFGATFVGRTEHGGATFLKYRLDTSGATP